ASRERSVVARRLIKSLIQVSPQWREVLGCEGFAVLCADPRPGSGDIHGIHAQNGVVLGALFEYGPTLEYQTPRPVADLSERESARIIATSGRDLIGRYWGRYVAFLRDPVSGTVRVLRDPTGQLPCFSMLFEGVTVIFSCVADCLTVPLLRFTVNWGY